MKLKVKVVILYLVVFLTFSQICISGPVKSGLGAGRLKKVAINAEKAGDIYTAIDHYEKYCQLKKDDIQTLYKLAELYKKSRDYKKAELLFEKIYLTSPKEFPLSLFEQAMMMKVNGKYKDAITAFVKFSKEYKGPDGDKYKKLCKSEVTGCELARNYADTVWNKAKPKVIVTRLDTSVNKANIEFAPMAIDERTMIFSSMRMDSVPYYLNDDTAKKPVRKFYIARKVKNNWTGGELYSGPFNDANYDAGNGVFSKDKRKFYFTYCTKDWTNTPKCAIYESSLDSNDMWTTPTIMPDPINISQFSSTMPAIGTDSKSGQDVIYFVSDRPGTVGGMDIWSSTVNKKTKKWGEAKNLGKLINTPGDEITPYYDIASRTLYFSSDRHSGMGGFDVFKSVGEQKNWTRPENMGSPINSGADDVYYAMAKTKGEGFFTSNREGSVALRHETCCDDIYMFQAPDLIKIVAKGTLFAVKDSSLFKMITKSDRSEFVNINKDDIDTKNVTLLSGKMVSLFMFKENTKDSVFISNTITDSKGSYYFNLEQGNNYIVRIENYGYDNKRLNISTMNIKKSDTIKVDAIYMKVIADNTGKIIKEKEAIRMNNITYEFGKADLTETAKNYLDATVLATLNKMPKIIVEIASHTDSVSNDAFNLKLSQKRAESVVTYLVSKGVPKERLIPKGYGESQPIARNTNPDGSDNPAGREKNRRTEFKIIGSTDQYYDLDQ